jgi:membrane-associated phospholipid phosphatase
MGNKNKSLNKFIPFFVLWLIFLFISKLESLNYFLEINTRVENIFIYYRSIKGVNFFKAITFFGEIEFIIFLTIIICFILWKYKKYKYIPSFFLVTGGAQLCNFILKIILHKARPLMSLVSETSYSFPSGHAVLAASFYGIIIYFTYKNLKNRILKFLIYIVGIIFIFSIGLSRVYLSAHFYSDVLAGWILGGVWLILGILLFRYFAEKSINKFVIPILVIVTILVSSLFFFTLQTPKTIMPIKTVIVKDALIAFNQEKLSKFTEKLDGSYQQPLSFFILVKSDHELINMFKKSGWVLADSFGLSTAIRLADASVTDSSYPAGPVTPSLWSMDVQNFSFNKPTLKDTIRERHHCRFWKTNIQTNNGKTLYVGTASYDVGIKWLITHEISADIDAEREYLFKDLLDNNKSLIYQKIQSVGKTKGKNFAGDVFYTDGKAYFISLN